MSQPRVFAGLGCAAALAAGLATGRAGTVTATKPTGSANAVAARAESRGRVRVVTAERTRSRRPRARVAQAADAYSYSPALVGRVSLSPMDFAPDGDASAVDYFVSWSGQSLTTGQPGSSCFETGVQVPNLSIMTQVRVYYTATDQSGLTAVLVRSELATGATTYLVQASLPSTGGTRGQAVLSIPAAVGRRVDNERYTYGAGVCLSGTGAEFGGETVRYNYSNAGD